MWQMEARKPVTASSSAHEAGVKVYTIQEIASSGLIKHEDTTDTHNPLSLHLQLMSRLFSEILCFIMCLTDGNQ